MARLRHPLREDTKPEPEDPYGIAKYSVELDLKAAKRLFGLNSIISRLHNVYGKKQNIGDKYRNVIGIFMNEVMQGQPCTIFGDGLQSRAFSHISDIAEGAALKLNLPPNALESYLRESIDFYLGAENLAGMELFFSQCEKAGLIPQAPRVEFAAAPARMAKATEAC